MKTTTNNRSESKQSQRAGSERTPLKRERERVRVEGAGLAGFESSDIVRSGQDRWVVEGCEGNGEALCVCV